VVDGGVGHYAKPAKWDGTGLGIARCGRTVFPDAAHNTNECWICRDVERSSFYSKTKWS